MGNFKLNKLILNVCLCITVCVLAAPLVQGQAEAQSSVLPVGTVQNVQLISCPSGFFRGTTCYTGVVSCPSTTNIQFTYGVFNPAGSPAGTIAFFSGGEGTTVPGNDSISTYVADGFQTVQVTWASAWEQTGTNPANIKTAACRPATLLQYIHQSVYTGGGMCAQGDSAGSAALAYSLTEYGTGSFLDNVQLLNGPVVSDVSVGCNPRLPPVTVCSQGCQTGSERGWPDPPQYVSLDRIYIDNWTNVSGPNACGGLNTPPAQYSTWKAMSIVDGLSDSTFVYPQTAVSGWICSNTSVNCHGVQCQNNTAAQGQIFYNQIIKPAAPFAVFRVDQCAGAEGVGLGFLPPPSHQPASQAITNNMVTNCRLRH